MMNRRRAAEIRGALCARFPGSDIEVSHQDDGAHVVIRPPGEAGSEKPEAMFSIGDGPSVLLSQLLTGYAT
jgi:hypothetical protein